MKPLLTLACSLLLCTSLFAQKDKDIPAFGKIDKSDLEMKECSIDKDAEAMNLIDQGTVTYEKGTKSTFALKKTVRSRIKIFKEKGFRFADVKISYYSDEKYERLSNIDAVIYNLDASGNIVETKVDKKSFFKQKLDANYSAITFTFPEVKEGCIIEYRYTLTRDAYSTIDPWIFQDRIPTKISFFKITLPEYFQFVSNKNIYIPIEAKETSVNQSINISGQNINYTATEYSYKVLNMPAMKEEPYMGAMKDYLQRIDFQLSAIKYPDGSIENVRSSWPELTKSLMESELFGVQMRKNISKGEELTKLLAASSNDLSKMNTIYKYVQKNMDWNGVEDFYCENVKTSWDKRGGSTGDINLILLNILKDVGIKAYPVLASTRDHGKIMSAYPFLKQFNTLIVLVKIGEKQYILNAADKFNPPGLIPHDVMASEVFIVDKTEGGFITLWESKMMLKHFVMLNGSVTDDGRLKGTVTLTSYDYAKNPRIKSYKEGKDKFTTSYLKANLPSLEVENLEVNNIDNDSLGLEQKFNFSIPTNSSGDYQYFTLNMFSGVEKNPFISDNRKTMIEFGYNQQYLITGYITIPAGFSLEQPPKNVSMIMPDTSIIFRRLIQPEANKIGYRITLDIKRPIYDAEEYSDFKEFYKKLFDLLNEQFVIRKKPNS
jgi:hypothetical protein